MKKRLIVHLRNRTAATEAGAIVLPPVRAT